MTKKTASVLSASHVRAESGEVRAEYVMEIGDTAIIELHVFCRGSKAYTFRGEDIDDLVAVLEAAPKP